MNSEKQPISSSPLSLFCWVKSAGSAVGLSVGVISFCLVSSQENLCVEKSRLVIGELLQDLHFFGVSGPKVMFMCN